MNAGDIRGWPQARADSIIRGTSPRQSGVAAMTLTPGLTLLGLVLVLLSIPLALSVGPLVLGVVVLAVGVRRAHEGLSNPV
jgi:hypothetical protein